MLDKKAQIIGEMLNIPINSVNNTIKLFDEGGTVPFIARYRKEQTGSLDEVQILDIKKLLDKIMEADKRRIAILKSIDEQGLLTSDIRKKLNEAIFVNELEDIYLPFKPKKKTRASIAIENGLLPLAELILKQATNKLDEVCLKFLNKNVLTIEDALSGARDIIAEKINEDLEARIKVRNVFAKEAILVSKVKKSKEKEGEKFKDYYEFDERLNSIPSHRFLALKRGESEGFLRTGLEVDVEKLENILERHYCKGLAECKNQVLLALKDSISRLLYASIANEFESKAKEKADKEAIDIFSGNLRQLLLAAPLGQKRVLGVDPGFRSGCKTVVLSEVGELLYETVIYPTFKKEESEKTLLKLLEKYNIEAIAIGNGTAGRETEAFVKESISKLGMKVKVFMVSEQGASIYSASEVAREEFPDKDLTVRGAVSIGRRLMDPLAELVKLEPKTIGVGQYQHDVNQKFLKESLNDVVQLCVNSVGVELNTASKHLLSYVSGIGPTLAQNIIDYRAEIGKFKNRNELKKVPRLGNKVFEQSVGFLRIRESKNPLDNTAVHPESYSIVEKMAKDLNCTIDTLIENKAFKKDIDLRKYVSATFGLPTLNDIIKELDKPGRDPREAIEEFEFGNVNSMEDLREGMELPGIVTNITAFGCFVDIGVHKDGLVHLSQLANRFIKDPNEVVKVHQKVRVKVTEIDKERKRLGLSMKL